jgi:hypothetical protein
MIAEHIHSATQLELLLLLHRDASVYWTAQDAAHEMRFPVGWAAEQLERFAAAGFIAASGQDAAFCYEPDADTAVLIDELAELYQRRRTSITALIFTPRKDDVRLLSDAFRIRRDEED